MASQPTAFRFQAFLCYSHRDSTWADWLHRALESYPIPARLVGLTTSAGTIPARLAPVFRDRDELPSATDLSAKVSDALAQSACLIVICSPHSAQSHWVNEEVEAFQRLDRAHRIFCLIVDGEPGASAWAGREHDECLPAALMHRRDAAGNATAEMIEPIAADARPGKDGRANARTKLVAGILGVDLDDLKHRERRRRRWRLSAAIAAGFALLCLTSALAVNAVIARHAAERRQRQAEDLIGYMLGDLDDKLRQVNRLDILESVEDRVVKYFAALPTADITNDTLAQRAKALLKIGSVRRDLGRIPEALDAFNLAFASSKKLVSRVPASVEYQTIYAESLTWLGLVDWSRGRLDEALTRFVAARDVLLRLQQQGENSNEVLDRLGVVRTNVGQVFETRGNLGEARTEYAGVMETYSFLERRQPEKLEWKAELGYAHKNLGRLALAEGLLEEGAREYVADRQIKASLAVLDPSNNERREDLAASNAALAWILYLSGQLQMAEDHLRQAVDGTEELLAIDPGATDWLSEAGRYGWMWGQVARARGDLAEAARRDEKAIARLSRLVAKDPDNVGWQREWIQAQMESARCLLAQGRFNAARGIAKSLQQALARLGAEQDRANALLIAQVDLVRGDIAAGNGDVNDASDAWTSARSTARAHAAGSKDPIVMDALASAALRLGRADEARPAIEMLSHAGYRQPDFLASLAKAGLHYESDGGVAARIVAIVNAETIAKTP